MSTEKEILGLEDQRFGAMIARDFAALDKLVHDQLLCTHSSGVTPKGWQFVAWQSCPQPA